MSPSQFAGPLAEPSSQPLTPFTAQSLRDRLGELRRLSIQANPPRSQPTDTASSLDASIHALEWYEKENGGVDGLLLLQPTSPFRRRKSIIRGIELFRANGLSPVVGVSPASSHPQWCFKILDNKLRPYIDGAGLHLRSQELPPAYVVNGAFYLIGPEELRRRRSFFSDAMACAFRLCFRKRT